MIKGIGIDIVELTRIESLMERNKRFVNRILTTAEQEIFNSLPSKKRQVEFLAGRFAGKEAFAKAVGTGIGRLSFQDINIVPDQVGGPTIIVNGYEKKNIFISISHSTDYAVAQVVIEH